MIQVADDAFNKGIDESIDSSTDEDWGTDSNNGIIIL